VRILEGFRSCVLEVRILRELRARFAEVRILRAETARRRRVLKELVESSEERAVRLCKEEIWLEGCDPHPRVFFVRVANKGVRLDAASTLANAGPRVVLFSSSCRQLLRAAGKGVGRESKVESLKLKEEESERSRLLSGLTMERRERWVSRWRGDFNAESTEFTEVGGRGREWRWRNENEKQEGKADPSLRSG